MSKTLDKLKEAEARRKRILAEREGHAMQEPAAKEPVEHVENRAVQARLVAEREALEHAREREREAERALAEARTRAAAEKEAAGLQLARLEADERAAIHARNKEVAETEAALSAISRAEAARKSAALAVERLHAEERTVAKARERAAANAQARAHELGRKAAATAQRRLSAGGRRWGWVGGLAAMIALAALFLPVKLVEEKSESVDLPRGKFELRLDRDAEAFAARVKKGGSNDR